MWLVNDRDRLEPKSPPPVTTDLYCLNSTIQQPRWVSESDHIPGAETVQHPAFWNPLIFGQEIGIRPLRRESDNVFCVPGQTHFKNFAYMN